jgi:phosphoribosylglycinamide formyltransferase 1
MSGKPADEPPAGGGWRSVSRPLNRPLRLAVLISGGGTTLINFLEQIAAGRLNAEVALVIASRADCGGVDRARRGGLRCEVVERKSFAGVAPFSAAIFELCREAQVDLVTLAGFLALIEVPDDFAMRVMNIHPALIPAFCGQGYYGHKVHEAVLERGARVSGCTVHFADNHYDHGPIIVQKTVDVLDSDTPETLAARVFTAECQAYPEAIRLYAAGRLEVCGQRVRVRS